MSSNIEEWERVISAAADLQNLVPGCVLVGGSATAIHAKHRLSMDADHILGDQKVVDALEKFDRYYQDVYRGSEVAPLNQLARQLAEPKPYDLDEIDIADYKGIATPLDRWENISEVCTRVSALLSDFLSE